MLSLEFPLRTSLVATLALPRTGVTRYLAPRINTRECSDFPPSAKMINRERLPDLPKNHYIIAKMNLKVNPVYHLRHTFGSKPQSGLSKLYYWVKRFIDIVLSSVALIILSPFFLVIAFLIKWDSEGPVFAKLTRISKDKEFGFYKFRSMVKDAHLFKVELAAFNNRQGTPFFKMKDDPRITRVGGFLRSHYLDELPSLINVLKGDIGLVGPRPHEPEEVALYKNDYPDVVAAKAGITCLPRLYNPHLSFEEEMVLEQEYLKKQSLWLDFKVLIKTLLKVLKDRPEG